MKATTYTPGLLIPRHVLTKISEEAFAHPNTETGAALIGIETPELMIVLGIVPDLVNIERQPGLFQNGGDYQVQLFRWYKRHWDSMRKKSRENGQVKWSPTTELPANYVPVELDRSLKFLGDWHKHPGSMRHLSSRDRSTIWEILFDPDQNRHQILSPIVTKLSRRNSTPLGENEMLIDNIFRMSWYYTNRNQEGPVGIKPFPVKNSTLPKLPPIPWHLGDLRRFDDEILYLGLMGYRTQWTVKDVDEDSICEIILSVESTWFPNKYMIITKWDYPYSAPVIYMQTLKDGTEVVGKYLNLENSSASEYLVDFIKREEGFENERPLEQSASSRGLRVFKFARS